MPTRWQPVDVDTYDAAAAPTFDGWAVLLEAIEERRPGWQADAACRGADLSWFFPERGQSTEPARALCATCPTAEPCELYALELDTEHGIWAGQTGRNLKRSRVA